MLLSLVVIIALLLFTPILCKQFRLPSIVGLILAGAAMGPYGLGVIVQNSTISLFAQLGMIYLMFLSGIEVDINDFRRSRDKGFLFGMFTFFLPAVLAAIVFHAAFQLSWVTALLLGSMCGSHTLLTYPSVSRYGVQRHSAVNIAVAATLLAVTLSLLLLGGISSFVGGEKGASYWWKMLGWTTLFLLSVVVVFPRLASWFIKRENDPVLEFLFIALMVAMAAWMADQAGLQAILGGFAAGIALNRRVPNLSPLMNRISFVGNTIFIPVFLLTVGMMIDFRVFFSNWTTLLFAVALVLVKLSGKWLSAYIVQRLLHLSPTDRRLLAGLTSASAAGTLAIVSIGHRIGLFSPEILNATVLLVLFSCIAASFLTENAARQLALKEKLNTLDSHHRQHILISLANHQTAMSLIDMALFSTPPAEDTTLTALAVITHSEQEEQVQPMLRQAEQYANAADRSLCTQIQLAANISNGVAQVIQKEHITQLITGININQTEHVFSQVLQHLIYSVPVPMLVYHCHQPINTIETLRVAVPRNAEREPGFLHSFEQIRCLTAQTGAKVVFYTNTTTKKLLQALCHRPRKTLDATFVEMQDWEDNLMIAKDINSDDMLIMLSARKGTISYNPLFETIPHALHKFFSNNSFIILYPEQTVVYDGDNLLSDTSYMIENEMNIYTRIKQFFLKQMRKRQRLVNDKYKH